MEEENMEDKLEQVGKGVYTYGWASGCSTHREERRKTSLHSEPLGCWWCALMARQTWLQHCLLNRMTLFALSLSLYPSLLLLLLLLYALAPPPLLCTLAGRTNCTAQQCSPTAAADPAWALRIWVGWDFFFFKGERNLQGQRVSTSFSLPSPAPHSTRKPPPRTISLKDSSQERPPLCSKHHLLFIFTEQQKTS